MNKIKGFTLIELIVVIAIIGMLSSIVLASVNLARMNARDAKRQMDLLSIRNALEMYYINHGEYPYDHSGINPITGEPDGSGSDRVCWKNQDTTNLDKCPLNVLLLEKLIAVVPTDPINKKLAPAACGNAQFYSYWSNGRDYLLGAIKEVQGSSGCTEYGNWQGPQPTPALIGYAYQFYLRSK